MDEQVGQVIRRRRGELGLTQEQLAKNAGIAPTSVVRLENGEIVRPRSSTLIKVAGALGIPPGELTRFVGTVHQPTLPAGVVEASGPFTAIYEHTDDGWWVASVPEIPGAVSQGRTLEEAREMIRDATRMLLEVRREDAEREAQGREVIREPLAL
jgi:predicted RNase H-like HicB family nuclease/DNA-binding Xre family transcriptional regulator